MSKVFLHIHDKGQSNWENKYYDFGRVPIEGEFLTVSSDSPWYRIELVVHTPFEDNLAAEVYAVKVDHEKIKSDKLNNKPGICF